MRAAATIRARDVRTVDVGIFLREFRFGALMLVVMTMTAPAALL
jgi:hypothetical protein